MRGFDELVDEAARASISGWDFSWLDGRASEARPSWHFRERVAERAATARAVVDIECGDGALIRSLPSRPRVITGVEAYQPGPGMVAGTGDALPLRDDAFDLVISRHPVRAHWTEIARVLEPGGTYFAQHVGPRSVAELSEWFLGPQPQANPREPETARANAIDAGLDVIDLRYEELPMTFDDVGAVIYFLRLVIWIVPNFMVEDFRDRLRDLHDHIEQHGPFRATSTRFLIEARKPLNR
ncbi:MAG: hypothetical protein QOF21_674 [Actinomycetota bacterium]|jgi:SAM-dependent methyltransferase